VNFTSSSVSVCGLLVLRPEAHGTRLQTPTLIGCCLLKSIASRRRRPVSAKKAEYGIESQVRQLRQDFGAECQAKALKPPSL
jgi:hypothetical protein